MSSKRETYRQTLRPLILAALNSPGLLSPGDFNLARYSLNASLRVHLNDPDIMALEDYLIDHSNLPGPRGDLELVGAFGDEIAAICTAPDLSLHHSYVTTEWLLRRLANRYPPAIFGSDPESPLQMPQFCAAVGLGEWAAVFHHIEAGVSALLEMGSSSLWRICEAGAMGLQRMLDRTWDSTFLRMQRVSIDASPYEWRVIIAGLAEPALLKERDHALAALDMHYNALAYLRTLPGGDVRKSDPVRTLRQALGYAVSVVVAAAPEPGFPMMQSWAAWNDPDVTWVIRENLKKKRLEKWPERLAALREALAL